MPATEQTWRDQNRLNLLFALSGLALLGATLVMFYRDHYRPWKNIQPVAVNVENKITLWREEQFKTDEVFAEHERLSDQLRASQTVALDPKLVADFREEVQKVDEPVLKVIDQRQQEFDAAVKEVETARATLEAAKSKGDVKEIQAADQTLRQKEDVAMARRRQLVQGTLRREVDQAKIVEDKQLNDRKIKSGILDAIRATYDLGVRDESPDLEQRAANVRKQEAVVADATAKYQDLSARRREMESIVKRINAPVEAAQKAVDDNQAALRRLESTYTEKRETYVNWDYGVPLPGKRVLNLPILDAFGTRRKVDNLWSDGLEQDYSHRKVRRFDRCTTCHQLLPKSLPGQPTEPAYTQERNIELVISPPESPAELKDGDSLDLRLEKLLGIRLAAEGVVDREAVTVKYVRPTSAGAKAALVNPPLGQQPQSGEDLRLTSARFTGEIGVEDRPGLMLGDVIAEIEGQKVYGSGRIAQILVDRAAEKRPVRVTVRRGLEHPFSTHPRLDLFISDSSPHSMGKFACTVCHEGQGSATDFRWASHTPNTKLQAEEWRKENGWFDNHHWIYPMYPQRFSESSCLKCHHNVVELEASKRFPEAPAPKVVHGYQVIRKFGCYGCHEVNGYDGPNRRVGPDLRIEPNYFAAAQGLQEELRWDLRQIGKQIGDLAGKVGVETGMSPANGDLTAQFERLAEQLQDIEAKFTTDTAEDVKTAFAATKKRFDAMHLTSTLAETIVREPSKNAPRQELRRLLDEDAAVSAEGQAILSPKLHRTANLLKDVEVPGTLRKPGPSLRFAAAKLDDVFLNDWIADPTNFRPTTRMPKFFKLWDHLKDHDGEMQDHIAPKLEPIEVRGLATYLKAESQTFVPLPRAEGITPSTDEEQATRGKMLFETRGCLACHTHGDFPDAEKYRKPEEIVQGPDLTGVGTKFAPDRNPQGPEWLYSWIKEPTRYHARTVMPNLFLNPEKNAAGDTFDPAGDIVAYLLSSKRDWKPEAVATAKVDEEALNDLTLQHLKEAVFEVRAKDYLSRGIPDDRAGDFKGVELELVVPKADYDAGKKLSDEQKLRYIGRKSVAKYGCFGCHDIPTFEDAKPIGTGLADWGRKDPAKLAFEHITHYKHLHNHGAEAAAGHGEEQETEEFFEMALEAGHRGGFAYQKLKEPRSYDYKKTEFKRYNERLRMPQFPFSVEEREAVLTFVLGLVADPPQPKFVYKPDARQDAILKGLVVLEKFNCGGCHLLEAEQWQLNAPAGAFGPQGEKVDYPFVPVKFSAKELEAAAKSDFRGMLRSHVSVLPSVAKNDALPQINDPDGDEVDDATKYSPESVTYLEELLRPGIVDGQPYQVGVMALPIPGKFIEKRFSGHGGQLTRYLLPRVLDLEKQSNSNASGSEAWGWLPPPLIGEGEKVQTAWLHDFLLNPYPIRPAVFLRMPKFNMSSDEASALVDYFAAVDNVNYPYEYSDRRDGGHLKANEAEYRKTLEASKVEAASDNARFDDAMKMVVDGSLCVKCHIVGDYAPAGSNRAKAPNLADVYRRMRPDYVRKWIANPKSILPYTSMPVNIPYKPGEPFQGGVSQELYHGTSVQQVDALVDLLMNFDSFAQKQTKISSMVKAPPTTPDAAPGEPPPPDAKPEPSPDENK